MIYTFMAVKILDCNNSPVKLTVFLAFKTAYFYTMS